MGKTGFLQKWQKIAVRVLWALLLFCLAGTGAAFASEEQTTGTIAIQLPEAADGIELTLYRVAEYENGSFTFLEAYAASGITIENLNDSSQAQAAALELEAYAAALAAEDAKNAEDEKASGAGSGSKNGLAGETAADGGDGQSASNLGGSANVAAVATADGSGSVKFSDLELGLYLVAQTDGTEILEVQSALLPLPYSGVESGQGWIYEVTVALKTSFSGGAVILTKTDDAGNVVEGASFVLQQKVYVSSEAEIPGDAGSVETGTDESGFYYWKEFDKVFRTSEFGQVVVTGLPTGDYRLVETGNPEGFVAEYAVAAFTISLSGTVTETNGVYSADSAAVQTLTVENVRTALTIYKVDEENNLVEGAVLVLKDADGKVILDENGEPKYQFTTADGPTVLYQIPSGTYYLSEVSAPEGYAMAEDVKFIVDDTAGVVNSVSMKDPKETETEGQSEDLTEGQSEDLTEGQSEDVTESQSEDLTEGQSEDLTEGQSEDVTEAQTEQPTESESESESESEKESESESEMESESEPVTEPDTETDSEAETDTEKSVQMTISVSKVDADTGEPLAGALLRVVDSDGTILDEWTSDGSAHTFTASLREGETCQLIEVSAPEGYAIADSQSFIAEDGGTAKLTMADPEHEVDADKAVTVSVTKTLIYQDGQAVQRRLGAVNETFYVALYSDESYTQRVSGIMALNYTHSDSSTVQFTGLDAGETYYVSECDANGNAIVTGTVSDDTVFYAEYENGNAAAVAEGGGSAVVDFVNEFYTMPSGFYREAELTITKKLQDADGQAISGSEVFYAGIFADPDYKTLSDKVEYNIIELDMAGHSEVSVAVYVALDEGEPVTLYITEVDEDGNPIAADSDFQYTMSADQSSVTVSETVLSANVTLTNREKADGSTPSGSTTETTNATETESTSVKTGDDTPLNLYWILLLAAMILLIGGGAYRRRSRREYR